jgi:hypothetical protein
MKVKTIFNLSGFDAVSETGEQQLVGGFSTSFNAAVSVTGEGGSNNCSAGNCIAGCGKGQNVGCNAVAGCGA